MPKILRYAAGTPGQVHALDAVAATKAVDVSVSTVASPAAKEAVDVSVSTIAGTKAKDAVNVSLSTVAATAVATGHLALKVEGYSWLKAMHGVTGSYIESSEVEIGGHTWKIRCYLNGARKEDAGWVSVFLHVVVGDSDAVVRAEYEFAVVRHHGPWPEHGPQCAKIRTSEGLCTFECKNNKSSWGYSRFMTVAGLEEFGFLKDDSFTVRCTVTVVEERTVKEEVVVPADDMARLMGMLCKCDDDRCKREHARPSGLEILANLCSSICRGTF